MSWYFVCEFHYIIQAAFLHVLTTQTGKCPVTMRKINTHFQKLEVLVSDLRNPCSEEYRSDMFWHKEEVKNGFKMADKNGSFDRLIIFLRVNKNI